MELYTKGLANITINLRQIKPSASPMQLLLILVLIHLLHYCNRILNVSCILIVSSLYVIVNYAGMGWEGYASSIWNSYYTLRHLAIIILLNFLSLLMISSSFSFSVMNNTLLCFEEVFVKFFLIVLCLARRLTWCGRRKYESKQCAITC